MTDPLPPSTSPLQIKTPCPKNWAELVGDDRRRFCSECSLHVHNAAQLTRSEAQTILAESNSRVCMRIEYDGGGTPIFRDSQPAPEVPATRRPAARLTRWVLSAAAGLLAACNGHVSTGANGTPPAGPNPVEPPSKMGKVVSTVMGDVATPPQVQAPQNRELLGEVAPPAQPPESPAPPTDQ